tara:strand:- start:156 stop:569 length:414 start_codon:yes stop_codon:yes gene_type:complete
VLSGCASISPASEDEIPNVEVVEQHDLSQNEAFNRLMRWAAETYNSANDVIQLSDREQGAIVAKGAVQPPGSTIRFFYTMTMDVRDGRVRIRQSMSDAVGAGGAFDYVSKNDARLLEQHFHYLRSSAISALEEEDDF